MVRLVTVRDISLIVVTVTDVAVIVVMVTVLTLKDLTMRDDA